VVTPPGPIAPLASPAVSEPASAPESETSLRAGFHNGLFFLRDGKDDFRLYPGLRGQVDSYNYFGKGVPDTTLKSTFFLRRVRPEFTGEVLGTFQFVLAGEFSGGQPPGVDNQSGKSTETSASAPGSAPTTSSGRYASAQTPSIKAAPTDMYLNIRGSNLFNVQVGQYDAPFTMENRTFDKYIPFMERSIAVRAFGVPTNKDIGAMVWGETDTKTVYYSVGIFNGDGQNTPNVDNRFDGYGRVFVHPFATSGGPLAGAQIGVSGHYGRRDKNYANYDYPSMTTQGNFKFWSSTFKGTDSGGNAAYLHVLPSGAQSAIAAELRIPYERFDLTSEFIWIHNETREAIEGYQSMNTERAGRITGYGYYAQLGFWAMGSRDINGLPGYEPLPHLDLYKPAKEATTALQLLVKWEQIAATYDSAARSGTVAKTNIDGDIKANVVSFGANYWATKHVRFSANYVMNMFPGSSATPEASQRAQAPGNTLPKGINEDARANAHDLHELLFRAGFAF